MQTNEAIVRELYAAAEGTSLDAGKFVAFFARDGYMLDVPTGTRMQGKAIGASIAGLVAAFPDLHRELLEIYVSGDAVIVELSIQGTHLGPLDTLAPTGKTVDVPCCDVFRLEDGKVESFHCYNMPTVLRKQLGG